MHQPNEPAIRGSEEEGATPTVIVEVADVTLPALAPVDEDHVRVDVRATALASDDVAVSKVDYRHFPACFRHWVEGHAEWKASLVQHLWVSRPLLKRGSAEGRVRLPLWFGDWHGDGDV